MKVTSAEFVKSAFDRSHWTADGLPEIAFLGRSNVGKSSLINSLLNRKGLARTSNTPGRTQSINFFLINDSFYFVDLPGYGYARVSKSMRQDWGKMAEDYLADRKGLVLCVQLVDARHTPTELDRELLQQAPPVARSLAAGGRYLQSRTSLPFVTVLDMKAAYWLYPQP